MSGSSTSSLSCSTAVAPSCSPSTDVSSCAERSAANPTYSQGGTRSVSTPARRVHSHAECVVETALVLTDWTRHQVCEAP